LGIQYIEYRGYKPELATSENLILLNFFDNLSSKKVQVDRKLEQKNTAIGEWRLLTSQK